MRKCFARFRRKLMVPFNGTKTLCADLLPSLALIPATRRVSETLGANAWKKSDDVERSASLHDNRAARARSSGQGAGAVRRTVGDCVTLLVRLGSMRWVQRHRSVAEPWPKPLWPRRRRSTMRTITAIHATSLIDCWTRWIVGKRCRLATTSALDVLFDHIRRTSSNANIL